MKKINGKNTYRPVKMCITEMRRDQKSLTFPKSFTSANTSNGCYLISWNLIQCYLIFEKIKIEHQQGWIDATFVTLLRDVSGLCDFPSLGVGIKSMMPLPRDILETVFMCATGQTVRCVLRYSTKGIPETAIVTRQGNSYVHSLSAGHVCIVMPSTCFSSLWSK